MTVERWEPDSEDSIRRAIDDGLLVESHYVDVKREVEPTAGARKELARDLASFAIDGGALLIGVQEDKANQTWQLAPISLAGEPERYESIANALIDPPLYVRTRVIASDSNGATGYVWIEVAPSADAPHMVDGVYFGRGDKTRVRLSDAQVMRHHAAKFARADVGARLLDEEISRDPVPVADRKLGHMYLVAQPLTGEASLARDFLRERNSHNFQLLIQSGGNDNLKRDIAEWAPTPGVAGSFATRVRGVARCSYSLRNARRWQPENDRSERRMIDIEMRDDGGIRVLLGRMTDERGINEAHYQIVNDGLAVAYVHRVISWSAALGLATGYRGSWVFGIAGNGLLGKQSVRLEFPDSESGFSESDYRETTTATHVEMSDKPNAIADRLVGPLLRGLQSYYFYRDYLEVD